jgi:hypothetical protein
VSNSFEPRAVVDEIVKQKMIKNFARIKILAPVCTFPKVAKLCD